MTQGWCTRLAAAALLMTIIAAIYGYFHLPPNVATHFNIHGVADGFGSKMTLLVPIVVLALGVFALMTVVGRLPVSLLSLPIVVTPENRAAVEAIEREFLACINLDCMLLFAWIEWSMIIASESGALSLLFLPGVAVLVASLFAMSAFYIASLTKL